MTVTKQPAVYTHTCDRCKATETSDDGALPGALRWTRLNARDLCGKCTDAFEEFMGARPDPVGRCMYRHANAELCGLTAEVVLERHDFAVRLRPDFSPNFGLPRRELKSCCAPHADTLLAAGEGWTNGVPP